MNRGSQWRLWDLHFHTPSSYDYKDKSVTNQQLIDGLKNANISVVAITDHHCIDVARIKELQMLGKSQGITVLPGIEFCSELGGSEAVHYIGIFDEKSNIETIWTKIQGMCSLTPAEIKEKGEERICCPFVSTAELIIQLGGIITIHAGKKSNSVECIKNNLLVKQELKQQLLSTYRPLLEVGKLSDITDYVTKVFPNIGFTLPTIICSDNHDIKNYSSVSGLWIKADPTFEGLKQVLFEPTERVVIGDSCPDYKSSYLVIDHVDLDEPGFWKQTINFNQNLNTIIGGRSTGKSTLISSIASKFDGNETTEQFILEHNNSVKVVWADGHEDYHRDLDFLRQSHMFDIAKDVEETNRLLLGIIKDKEDCRIALDQYNRKVTQTVAESQRVLNSLEDLFAQGTEKQDLIKQFGDKTGIEKEILILTSQRNQILKETKIDTTQINKYSEYTERITKLQLEISGAEQEVYALKNIRMSQFLAPNKGISYSGISKEIVELIIDKISDISKTANLQITEIVDSHIAVKENKIKQCKVEIGKIQSSTDYAQAKVVWDQNKKLIEIDKRINDERIKLQKYTQLTEDFTRIKTQVNTLRVELINVNYIFQTSCHEVCEKMQLSHEGVEIKSIIELDELGLQDYLDSSLDQRGSEMKNLLNEFVSKYKSHDINYLVSVIKKANNSQLALKRGVSTHEFLTKLFTTNWFKPRIQLFYENDRFDGMSQGKQAFVILKLLLEFSQKQCPILIDQPEDSLDNRAIYNELVRYIRLKKKHRQIILVTHNPNVVVGADAEEVIIANQQGSKTPNENDIKFQYRYGSLEDTSEINHDLSIPILHRMGIREHVCDILEGGKEAFANRERKYGFKR